MTTFHLQIKSTLQARNLDSATRKVEALKERLVKAGVDYCELHLDGEPSASGSAQETYTTSTKERP